MGFAMGNQQGFIVGNRCYLLRTTHKNEGQGEKNKTHFAYRKIGKCGGMYLLKWTQSITSITHSPLPNGQSS